jgi:hypothetical protein
LLLADVSFQKHPQTITNDTFPSPLNRKGWILLIGQLNFVATTMSVAIAFKFFSDDIFQEVINNRMRFTRNVIKSYESK